MFMYAKNEGGQQIQYSGPISYGIFVLGKAMLRGRADYPVAPVHVIIGSV